MRKAIIFISIVLILSGCMTNKTVSESVDKMESTAKTFEFVCPDGARLKVIYHENGERATLFFEDRKIELDRAISGSGARYSDGHVVFWNKGDEALIEIDGEIIHQECKLLKEP